jgi:hypothetical protein
MVELIIGFVIFLAFMFACSGICSCAKALWRIEFELRKARYERETKHEPAPPPVYLNTLR